MAEISGASSITLPGLEHGVGSAEAVVGPDGAHVVTLSQPRDGNRVQSTAVALSMVVAHTGSGTATDVQVEISQTPDFAAVDWNATLLTQPDGHVTVIATGLTDLTTYYWRARAAYAGSGLWQPWSPIWSFTVDTATGRAFGWVDLNSGLGVVSDPDGVWHAEENVGMVFTPDADATGVVHENVSMLLIPDGDAYGYVHEGDVSTNTPVPHLWFLKPPAGRPGDGIRIFCFGVGDLQATYGAVVEVRYPAPRGWVAVPVISWQTYPPTVNAYTELRELDPSAEKIDMQHQVVEITVPGDSLPPGYPIRIRTEGP